MSPWSHTASGDFVACIVGGGGRVVSCRAAHGHSEKVSWFARQLRLHLPALDRLNRKIVGNVLDAVDLPN